VKNEGGQEPLTPSAKKKRGNLKEINEYPVLKPFRKFEAQKVTWVQK